MVAYGALVSLLQILDTILHPVGGRRIYHNRAQLKSLHEKVSFLLDFLENYSPDYGEEQDSGLESVETKIRDAAFRAKDVIESDISDQLVAERYTLILKSGFELMIVGEFVRRLRVFPVMRRFLISVQSFLPVSFQIDFLAPPKVVFLMLLYFIIYFVLVRYWLLYFAPENKNLRGEIEHLSLIIKEVIQIKDACGSRQDRVSQSQRSADGPGLSRRDFRGTEKNAVVGLDSELRDIYDHLLGYQPHLQVVSIVGMGGIGKTTLARQVYDDPHIVYHFDICAWITVSQKYSLRHLMSGLLESAKISTEEILQNYSEDELDQKLGEHLHKSLMSRRYLIVMDDVWDTNVWDLVRMFFPDNSDRSRVLLTSRLSEVASYANPHAPPLQMRFLNDGDSWNLFRQKVFGGEDCPLELEAIGRTIAGNCSGLPLAIVVVGGLLYNEGRTERDWMCVSRNLNSILRKDDEQCLGILGLSYNHLPHHLKPCFLYMGSFRQGQEVHVTRVYNLWGAEGFLKPRKDKSSEEVAEEYLEDLIQRSLVLVGKRSCDGKIMTCKIHDLIWDVCWLNAGKEKFLYFDREDYGGDEIWHRVGTLFDFGYASGYSRRFVMARSFIFAGGYFDDLSYIHFDFRLLRAVDVVGANLNEFPDEVFELVHLRYLGLTYNCSLPQSISRLWNLQTIVFNGRRFGSNRWIPVEIWSMPNLRHLYFSGDFLPQPPSWNTTVLENLQTLVGISHFRCTKGILKCIPNLKELGIFYPGSVDWSKYELESVVNLHQLEILNITVSVVWGLHVRPPKLAFPEKITKLGLMGCRMPWESMRVVGALPNLQVLELINHACEGQIWEAVEGEFCQLMFLQLESMNLEQWNANEAHYPRLQRLILRNMFMLKEVPCAMGEIPTLEIIELVHCRTSAVASAEQILKEQQSMGNEYLKIRIQISKSQMEEDEDEDAEEHEDDDAEDDENGK